MNFHAPVSQNRPLELPLMFGHFVPWFTRRADAFPLTPEEMKDIRHVPEVENERHWQDARSGYRRTHLAWPEIGTYDSRDPAVIAWQIATALDYGV